ncbi:hypothetical protein BCR44DRAFT_1106273 [Catenaria anguillulae PL171]|uniref:DUF6604 domain-containing protein n=1 Tax=Catenaria anguillulae PL171 TaxID=765915 RepID=A0A1Y2HP44_9FUNG|nr:hypothetical protein BCR44DRAFT_1106273 [Catenaria anguillulae PL171]
MSKGCKRPKHKMTTAAPLPSHLFDAYKRYKMHTARLASWLGAMSDSLGYNFADIPSAKAPAAAASTTPDPAPAAAATATGRAKGKARQKAAAAAAAPPALPSPLPSNNHSNDDDTSTPTTIMTTRDFITLAQFISAKDPPVTVPARVIDWACRAIQSRRVCAAWFNAVQDASAATDASNQTHAHFIGVLEQVVGILAPRVGGATKPDRAAEGLKEDVRMSGVELLASRFAALAVDDEAGDENGDDADGDEDGEWAAVFAMVQETLMGKKVQSGGKKGGKVKAVKVAAKRSRPNLLLQLRRAASTRSSTRTTRKCSLRTSICCASSNRCVTLSKTCGRSTRGRKSSSRWQAQRPRPPSTRCRSSSMPCLPRTQSWQRIMQGMPGWCLIACVRFATIRRCPRTSRAATWSTSKCGTWPSLPTCP